VWTRDYTPKQGTLQRNGRLWNGTDLDIIYGK
jgi:hypothetical protein